MLKHLSIQNYALIQQLDLDFQSKLTAITGETGSGKSILLGALGLILGKRADHKVIGRDNKKCVVEATFTVAAPFKPFFDSNQLDFWEDCIVRREISGSGKSRAFINDTPVTLDTLTDLGQLLIDIHSQQDNRLINDAFFRLKVVDTAAHNEKEIQVYREGFESWHKAKWEYQQLKSAQQTAQSDLDYMQFQWQELEELQLDRINQEELEDELNVIRNAETIIEAVGGLSEMLRNGEENIINHLRTSLNRLHPIADVSAGVKDIYDRLKSAEIELNDLALEAESIADSTQSDPERAQEIEDRLNELYRLQQKHRVEDVAALIALRDELATRIDNVANHDERLHKLKDQVETLYQELVVRGAKLSATRRKSAPLVAEMVRERLAALGLEHARFEIGIEAQPQPDEHGLDVIDFQFSANPGHAMQALETVASGGEMARVMLAFKCAFSSITSLPTLILDEIDTGVSGEIALKVGRVLRHSANDMQVITITHLPQVAAQADHHFKVAKSIANNMTETGVQVLNQEDRIQELAEMIAGKKVSDATYKSVRELLATN
ncbi:MAG: DNA repair protein RecN [Flavobacteriales bacterium]|nr:DNA repair protein RecN [Flavobacteriales bacterium]